MRDKLLAPFPDFIITREVPHLGYHPDVKKIPRKIQDRFNEFARECYKITSLEMAYAMLLQFEELSEECAVYPVDEYVLMAERCFVALVDLWATIDEVAEKDEEQNEVTREHRKEIRALAKEMMTEVAAERARHGLGSQPGWTGVNTIKIGGK